MKLLRIIATAAPSGNAYFYEHGTVTTATVYSDYDGETIVTGAVALDANGYAQVYVDSLVDVVVEKNDGTQLQTFVAADGDNSTIVQSQSFTGTLSDGSSGAGGKTTLREVLDQLYTSFGARDFLVRQTGGTTDQTLVAALNSIRTANSPFFNVLDYGAIGDGTTDDHTSVSNAVAAALAAGGGIVYFPAGTYLMTAALSVGSSTISLLGAGSAASVLSFSSTTGNGITFVGGSSMRDMTSIRGLSVIAATTSSGYGISVASSPGLVIEDCYIDNYVTAVYSTTPIIVNRCTLIQDGIAGSENLHVVSLAVSAAGSVVSHCHVTMDDCTSLNNSPVYSEAPRTRVLNNYFDMTAMTTPTGGGFIANSEDCWFVGNFTGAASTIIGLYMANDYRFYEANNAGGYDEESGLEGYYDVAGYSPITEASQRGSRVNGVLRQNSLVASDPYLSVTILDGYETHFLTVGSAVAGGGITIANTTTTRSEGEKLTIIVRNESAESITVSYDTDFIIAAGSPLAAGDTHVDEFVVVSGEYQWRSSKEYTPPV
jgi:hypothetical protein